MLVLYGNVESKEIKFHRIRMQKASIQNGYESLRSDNTSEAS